MAGPYYEPGNKYPLVTLGGSVTTPGQGRVVDSGSLTATVAAQVLLSSNPKRISAIIQNLDDAAHPGSLVYVNIGNSSADHIVLAALGSLQIDKDFPWIGEIDVSAPSNSPVVNFVEIGIP